MTFPYMDWNNSLVVDHLLVLLLTAGSNPGLTTTSRFCLNLYPIEFLCGLRPVAMLQRAVLQRAVLRGDLRGSLCLPRPLQPGFLCSCSTCLSVFQLPAYNLYWRPLSEKNLSAGPSPLLGRALGSLSPRALARRGPRRVVVWRYLLHINSSLNQFLPDVEMCD